jgi:hypothetical protein
MHAMTALAERAQRRLEVPQEPEMADAEENTQVQSSGLSPTEQAQQRPSGTGLNLGLSGRVQTVGNRRRGPLPVNGHK